MYDSLSMGPSGTLKARKERKVSLLLRRTSDALVSCFGSLTQSSCCLDQGHTATASTSTSSCCSVLRPSRGQDDAQPSLLCLISPADNKSLQGLTHGDLNN